MWNINCRFVSHFHCQYLETNCSKVNLCWVVHVLVLYVLAVIITTIMISFSTFSTIFITLTIIFCEVSSSSYIYIYRVYIFYLI